MLRGKYARVKVICSKCGKEISSHLLELHQNSGSCKLQEIQSLNCVFCGLLCKNKSGVTNHSKVCSKNPDKIPDPRKGIPGHPVSVAHKLRLAELYRTNKPNGFGGYQKNAGTGKRYKVLDSYNNEVTLQSSYEKLMQEWLDLNNVKWIRPNYLPYDNRKYFPDFYLTEHNIYIDTKNEYLAKIDKEKLDKVRQQNNVTLLLVLKENINDNLFKVLLP